MNALLSVYDKVGLVPFAEHLVELGFDLFSSGGTAKAIAAADMAVNEVGINILDHCVVTLVPQVHGGLLAKHGAHDQEMARNGYAFFDLACVDLYPMQEAIANGASAEEVIKATDIGGPTMLRSAVKGGRLVLCKPKQREPFIDWVRAGMPNEEYVRNLLAYTAEKYVADYVRASAEFRNSLLRASTPECGISALGAPTSPLIISSLAA